jgi:two-component system, NarL family, invasion response regulator UvrY
MKKILICDDHTIIIRGLKFILNTHFKAYQVDEVHSIKETMAYLKKSKPDFAILDLQLSDGNMIETLPNIFLVYPTLDVLIFSMTSEEIYAKRILQQGAKGFLNKDADEEEVLRALKIFLGGENYISQRLNNLIVNNIRNNKSGLGENPFVSLSNREIEVVQHLLSGKPIKLISEQMNLHANSIVTYKGRLFSKLGIKNLVDLTNLAKVYDFM